MTLSKGEGEFHRRTGAPCFNEAWDYLEKKDRDAHDDQHMLYLAHASRFHWSLVGTPRNKAVGDWQISRVYSALNQPQLALRFANSSLELCQKYDLSEILCTAYEAIARAYAVAKDHQSAKDFVKKAYEQLDASSVDDEDREIYLGQIRETEGLIGQ